MIIMKKFKIILSILVICFMFATIVACGNIEKPTSADTNKVEGSKTETAKAVKDDAIYYTIGMNINIPYWQDHKKGLEAAAAELGVKAVFTGENGNDAANQINIFEQVLAKKPAGILVSPIDPEGMIPAINKAIEAGVPVVCIDSDAPKSKRLTYFGTGNYEAGYAAADILAKAIGEKGEVGLLTIPGIFCLDERQRGFEQRIKDKYSNIKLVSVQNDEGDPTKAASVTSQMLQAKPNLVGLFGDDAASGVGAAAALREGNKLGKIKVVAFDKDSAVLDLVEQGSIEATMVQRTFTMSYYALKFLNDYNNKSVKMATDMKGINPLPQLVDTGIMVVDKESAKKFK